MPKPIDFSQRATAPIWARGTGTVYTMTAVSAAIAFGTLSPAITLAGKGTWRLSGYIMLRYEGATFAAARTVTLKFRRTNNTAADIDSKVTTTGIVTTITDVMGRVQLDPVDYTTSNEDDAVALYADVSVIPSAGTFTVVDAYIRAEKVEA